MTADEVLALARASGLALWREGDRLLFEGEAPSPELVSELRRHKRAILERLDGSQVPTLPTELAPLVRAAASGTLSGAVMLESGLVPDVGRYVTAWAASYLVGDRDHAVSRLREVRKWWSS